MINVNGRIARPSVQSYQAPEKSEESQTGPSDGFFPSNVALDTFYGVLGAGISAVPVLGAAVLDDVAEMEDGFLLNSAPAINIGSTIAVGVGLVAGGSMLAAGLTGLGFCALVGGVHSYFNHE